MAHRARNGFRIAIIGSPRAEAPMAPAAKATRQICAQNLEKSRLSLLVSACTPRAVAKFLLSGEQRKRPIRELPSNVTVENAPFRRTAPPHELGRKRGTADIGQSARARYSVANDPIGD